MPPSSWAHGVSPLVITSLPGRAGLRLVGEVDVINHGQFRSALAALLANCPATIHLDTAGLRFIDVAGTGEIITALRSRPGLRIILHSPPRSLRRIITLLWPEANIKITGPMSRDIDIRTRAQAQREDQTNRRCMVPRRGGHRPYVAR